MKILTLIREGFDSMENRNPWYEERIASFCDSENQSAKEKLEKYKQNLNTKEYSGWDGETYPKFKVVEEEVI